ncbi:hypothetical protein FQA39_LY14438 [Lamprigera yunnana]|nr:hypothetical protein FQA39_LY14438 [Lamprigera yunnana]
MSCQIKLTGNIPDIPAIRRCLFPTDDVRGSDSWLQLCEISASPTGDTLVLAHEKRLVILTAKWDSNDLLNRFEIQFSGTVVNDDPIRAILCLPVVIQSQSSQVGPEWVCIAVGLNLVLYVFILTIVNYY